MSNFKKLINIKWLNVFLLIKMMDFKVFLGGFISPHFSYFKNENLE